VIDQQDAEGVVVDQLAHRARDLAEQVVQIENRGELARDIGERLQGAVRPLDAQIEARVVDRHADARGDQPQQGAIVFRIGVDPRRLQVDDAHQALAGDHRRGQLRAHRVDRVQVARIAADVAHQHRLAARGGGAGQAFAERDGQIGDQFLAIADRVADAQAMLPLAIEEDREQVVRQHPLDHFGYAFEQPVEV
jgi:uncharacterized protein (DUF736 family)